MHVRLCLFHELTVKQKYVGQKKLMAYIPLLILMISGS